MTGQEEEKAVEPNNTVSTDQPTKRNRIPLVALLVLGLVLVAALGGFYVTRANAQPQTSDFQSFDKERKAIDTSVEAYGHMLGDYSRNYTNANLEGRSTEEKDALKRQAEADFKAEGKIGRERLNRMASSLALKDETVKTRFETFRKQYESVFNYYDKRLSGVSRVTSSVAGPCAELTKLNVKKESYPQTYVEKADVCLKSLSDAKTGSDKDVTTLLGDVEEMIRKQRDLFQKTTKLEDGPEKSAQMMLALAEMLQMNANVASFQSTYEKSLTQEYNELALRVNGANKALEEVLSTRLSVNQPAEMATRR